MRIAWVIGLSLVTLSGCASEEAPEEVLDDPPVQGNVTVPEPLHFAGSLKAVAAPVTGTTTGCELEQGCASHEFTIEENLSVEIVLKSIDGTVTGVTAGVLYGSDYDMTLRDGTGRDLGTSTNPSGQDDAISAKLAPGSYVVDILAWHDQDGSYDLTITFSAPAVAAAEA